MKIGKIQLVRGRSGSDNFDAMRLFASLTVVYGHAFALSGVPAPGVMGNAVQALAVKVFFVISGYLVSKSWLYDPSLLRFFAKRVLRISPGLILVVLLSTVILGPLDTSLSMRSYFGNPLFKEYFNNIILYPVYSLPGLFHANIYPNAVNGSLWSLPVEFFMYMILPLVAVSGRWAASRVVAIAVIISCISLFTLRSGLIPTFRIVVWGTSVSSVLDVMPYFFIGMVWQVGRRIHKPNPQIAFALIFAALLAPIEPLLTEVILYIVLPYTVLAFATAEPSRFGWCSRFGDLSYGIYLFGFPVEQLIVERFHTAQHPLHTVVFSLPFVFILAMFSWHFVEHKMAAFKPKRPTLMTDSATSEVRGVSKAHGTNI